MTTEEKINEVVTQVSTYSKLQTELLKLRGIEATANAGSQLFSRLFTWIVLLLACIFAGIAAALYLSKSFNSIILGFLGTAGVYLIVWLVLVLVRKKLIAEPLKNKIIFALTSQEENPAP